jgi:hypothetical protein
MRKNEELNDPKSCMSRAHSDELTFVLLGRDSAAPVAIRAWITERLRLGKNVPEDLQITEAEETARRMELERSIPRHKHSRSCYDDPGPGHGSAFTVCGKVEGQRE